MIDIFETHAVDLARAVVAAVPSAPAGSYGDINTDELRIASQMGVDSPYPLLSAPSSVVGTLQVCEGPSTEWRMSESGPDLIWADREGLGRYVLTREARLACDDTRLATEINRHVKVVVDRIREKREHSTLTV